MSTPKRYRVTTFVRLNNAFMSSLLRLGIPFASFVLLTVPGRKSGTTIRTPVAVFVQVGERYLIAAYGVVNWVRNLRAAGGEATLLRGRHRERIHASELPPELAAPIFRAALLSGPPGIPAWGVRIYRRFFALPYLSVTLESTLEEFEREVRTHPVFRIQGLP
jgi:hypothetical protein